MSEPRASRVPAADDPDPPDDWRLLPWQDVVAEIERAERYWLATTRSDGSSHVMPVWGIWLDDALLVDVGRESRKGRNLALMPRAALHLDSADPVVVLEGGVEEVHDAGVLDSFAGLYRQKYGVSYAVDPATRVVYAFAPQLGHAWLESDHRRTGTRFTF